MASFNHNIFIIIIITLIAPTTACLHPLFLSVTPSTLHSHRIKKSVTSDTSDSDEDMETILTPPPHHSNDETPPPHHSNDETPPPQRSKDETPPLISCLQNIQHSHPQVAKRPKNDVTIAQILEELAEKINSKDICKFNINRANVLDGAIRGFRRLTYNPCSTMTIKFSDDKGTREEAIDLGGPKREFLRLLVEALSQCDMFEGQEGHLNLALDSTALREDLYYHAGTAVAVCLVHGGPSPSFLSKTLFDWIAHGLERCRPVLEDIGDFKLRQKLEQISEAKTLGELKATAEPLTDYLAIAGCLRNLSSLADKDQLVQDIMMFHVIHRVRGPFERFREGLKTLGILEKIQLHSDVFRKVLCYTPDGLSADNMDDLFEIRWSETGSNRRREENKVVAYWRDFLQDAEEESGTTTLQEILTFATGSNMVPPIGFAPQPSVEFLHNGGKYPTANTCINCLHLPIHARYDDFKNAMHFAIQNTQGFGMA
ncbi:G2/M phase-specific E3 ubiquitin-protein ligase-like [Lampris incognitus]|uniref:G2/M phase-specific E3 ubiquitin-protein ligase-like n=1 Tax=Lampris incognitus TaxID=2546036 RepID=UPI0024B50DEF|nr:G2/M phase-specific E3 ubiquitin-protein ligase-like [Lampris incognitus]